MSKDFDRLWNAPYKDVARSAGDTSASPNSERARMILTARAAEDSAKAARNLVRATVALAIATMALVAATALLVYITATAELR